MTTSILSDQSFVTLGVRARMSLLANIRTESNPQVKESMHMAVLWINTALDAVRVGETLRAKIHLQNARAHLRVAKITQEYEFLFPIAA